MHLNYNLKTMQKKLSQQCEQRLSYKQEAKNIVRDVQCNTYYKYGLDITIHRDDIFIPTITTTNNIVLLSS